jgi:hypothetical protein
MFKDQAALAESFYQQALSDYIEACEQTCNLYEDGKKPAREELVRAGTRFKSAYAKLLTVIRISNFKFGTTFTMTHFVLDTAWCEKVQ